MSFKKILCLLLSIAILVVSTTGCKKEETKPKKKVVVVVYDEEETESNVESEKENESNEESEKENESNIESEEENVESNVDSNEENTESDVDSNEENTESDVLADESEENNISSEDDTTDELLTSRVKRELYKPEVEGTVESLPVEYKKTVASWDGPQGYVIIVPADDDTVKHSAELLKEYFSKKAGVKLSIKEDTQKATAKEILVGKTNRNVSKTDYDEGEYAVKLYNKKLSFEGGHWNSVENAVKSFVSLKYTSGKVNTLTGSTDFVSKKEGYTFVWGDDFSGNTLDSTKWTLGIAMTGSSIMKLSDDPRVMSVDDGQLKLNSIHYYNPSEPQYEYAVTYSVFTRKTMAFKYGYLEMKARVPYKKGAWPSFWLNNDDGTIGPARKADYMTEIDIFEVFENENTAVPNIHKWYRGTTNAHTEFPSGLTRKYEFSDYENLSNEYHIYGFEWTPTEMTMYVDGKKYMTYDLSFNFDNESDMLGFHDPQAIILNNHMRFNGEVNPPNEYHIDYIRLYQKSNGELYTAE